MNPLEFSALKIGAIAPERLINEKTVPILVNGLTLPETNPNEAFRASKPVKWSINRLELSPSFSNRCRSTRKTYERKSCVDFSKRIDI